MILHILRSVFLTLGFVIFLPLLGWLIIPYALLSRKAKIDAPENTSQSPD